MKLFNLFKNGLPNIPVIAAAGGAFAWSQFADMFKELGVKVKDKVLEGASDKILEKIGTKTAPTPNVEDPGSLGDQLERSAGSVVWFNGTAKKVQDAAAVAQNAVNEAREIAEGLKPLKDVAEAAGLFGCNKKW